MGNRLAGAASAEISGKHLRAHARQNRIGNGCPPRLKSVETGKGRSGQRDGFDIKHDEYVTVIKSLEGSNERTAIEVVDVAAGGRSYKVVRIVSKYEIEGEGFGELEERESRRVHSFVEKSTGGILLPRAGGSNESQGPEVAYGYRANIFDDDSGASALKENGDVIKFAGSVKELIALGVDADAPNAFGETALMQAAAKGRNDLCEYLSSVADVNATTDAGATALMKAVEKGDDFLPVVKTLLLAGAEVGMCNRWGTTALHIAAYAGFEQIARLLCEYGADVDAEDELAKTPVDYACEEYCRRNEYGEPDYNAELEEYLVAQQSDN